MASEKSRMLAGELYLANCPELAADNKRASEWMTRYNASPAASTEERHAMLVEQFKAVGEGAVIRPPFYCDYGYNITLGNSVFLNFNCILLDVVEIVIGDLTQIGPGVQILTPDHPRDPEQRRRSLEFGRPVHIGSNVWIGGGALVMPGVSIGDDAIVGSGAVVTRDVRAQVTVVGNPAKPVPGSRQDAGLD